jgi:putative ABC transport system permease protein
LQEGDRTQVLLGFQLAKTLDKKVGDTIDIQGEKCQVVGVYKVGNFWEDGAITMVLHEFQGLMEQQGRVTGFSVVLDHTPGHAASLETVKQEIQDLKDDRGRPLGLSAEEPKESVTNSAHMRLARAMAWLTSAIAVVIGAIGMLNTMIMSVLERVREIGILRAVGWRKGRVVRMILGESLMLSLAGAVAGTIGAVVLTRLLTHLPAVNNLIEGDIAPKIMVEGFLMALLLGLIGGTYPAYRASQLLPTEALRHE